MKRFYPIQTGEMADQMGIARQTLLRKIERGIILPSETRYSRGPGGHMRPQYWFEEADAKVLIKQKRNK